MIIDSAFSSYRQTTSRQGQCKLGVLTTCVCRRFVGDSGGRCLRRTVQSLATANELRQRGAESPTTQAVDDEVHRRVGDHQKVAQTLVEEKRTGADETAMLSQL